MYTKADIKPFSTWRHATKGGTYVVIGISLCCTNGPRDKKVESVIYYSVDYQGLRDREVDEWLDGRFVPCEAKS